MFIIDDIFAVVEYMTSDQEAEGRALAIKKASEIYTPVLSELEEKAKKQKMYVAKTDTFLDQAKKMRDIAAYYVGETDKLILLIDKIKEKDARLSDSLFFNTRPSGCLGGAVIAYWGPDIAGWLNGVMDEKRKKFFEIEITKQCKVWEEKIDSVKKENKKITLNLKNIEEDDKLALQKLKELLQKAIDEYEKVSEQHYLLVHLEKNI